MKFDRRYWIVIAAAMSSATVSSACTLFMASTHEHFMECNSVAAACFATLGMVPSMVLGILALLPIMVAIPWILRQNERPGLLSMLILLLIAAYTFFDAVNDVSAVMGYQNTFLIAHAVIDTANNVSGTALGTGSSLC